MNRTFVEMKLFQVRPDRLDQFERMIEKISNEQLKWEALGN